MATETTPSVPTANIGPDPDGSMPAVVAAAPQGVTVDEMTDAPRRRLTVKQRVSKVGTIAATVLKLRASEVKLQIRIGHELATAEPLFVDDDGKPGVLPITVQDIDGGDIVADLSFNEWAERKLKLNYSSMRQYVQAGRFADAHPSAVEAGKVGSILAGALLEGASVRKPEAVAAILADLAPGATIDTVKATIEKHAPKPVKPIKVQDTSKVQTDLELKARDKVWPLLSLTCAGMDAAVIVALQDYAVAIATMATDPDIGKGRAVFASALGQLHREWNAQREAAAEKKAAAEAKRQARKAA